MQEYGTIHALNRVKLGNHPRKSQSRWPTDALGPTDFFKYQFKVRNLSYFLRRLSAEGTPKIFIF